MAESNDFAMGYAMGQDSNGGNCCNNGWGNGMDGWWGIILFAMIFGWGGGGFGNGGWGGANGATANGMATRADLAAEFGFNGLENAVRGISQGICDSTYTLNNAINNANLTTIQGFHGVDNAICNLGWQTQQGFNNTNVALMQGQNALQSAIDSCCCQTQRAIEQVNYNAATQACETRQVISNGIRDVLDNNNSNTRAILDFLTQSRIDQLQNENQTLKLAASQNAQNAFIDASLNSVVAQLKPQTPVPSYPVPAPFPYCVPNGYNYSYNGGCCNSGCC